MIYSDIFRYFMYIHMYEYIHHVQMYLHVQISYKYGYFV